MMQTDEWKKRLIWLLYVPVGIYIFGSFMQILLRTSLINFEFLIFLILGILVAYFPIRAKDQVFSLLSGISLTIYVLYGIIPSIFLSCIALIAILIRADVKLDQHYRYPLNLLSESLLLLLSAEAYTLVENLLVYLNLSRWTVFPLSTYLLAFGLFNQLFAYIVDRYFYRVPNPRYFDDLLVFLLRNMFIILPLAYVLIFMTRSIGLVGVLVGAVPFLTVTIGMKYYYKTTHNNKILNEMNHYVQKLTLKKKWKDVIGDFMRYTIRIFPSDQIYYFAYDDDKKLQLESILRVDEHFVASENEVILPEESKIVHELTNNKLTCYARAKAWRTYVFNEEHYKPESAIVLPVCIFDDVVGLILITHQHRAVYDDFLLSLIEVFYQYFKISLNSVYQYESLKGSNYTDYLTQLPNLRDFSKRFETVTTQNNYEQLAMIVLDLDHFKAVNDIHGHEAGNEVLIQVADILRGFVNEHITAFRYGGEEFIVLVKNRPKEEAYELAEEIRRDIEMKDYEIDYSIKYDGPRIIRVTASLGVSTYPENAEHVQDLVKYADRAMYSGSKQSGRNMVTVFNKGV